MRNSTYLARIAIISLFISILTNCGLNRAPERSSNFEPPPAPDPAQLPPANTFTLTKREELVLGITELKTLITASKFGGGKRYIVVLGGIHGDEQVSTDVAEALIWLLERSPTLGDMTIIVVPAINPDGIAAGTRTNSNEVDINRNFPARSWQAKPSSGRYAPGKRPGSELETQALIKLLSKPNIALVVSIHAPLNCINWDGPARDIALAMSEASGLPVKEHIGYETPGSLGSYLGKERGVPTITLELPLATKSESVVRQGVVALQAAIAHLQRTPD